MSDDYSTVGLSCEELEHSVEDPERAEDYPWCVWARPIPKKCSSNCACFRDLLTGRSVLDTDANRKFLRQIRGRGLACGCKVVTVVFGWLFATMFVAVLLGAYADVGVFWTVLLLMMIGCVPVVSAGSHFSGKAHDEQIRRLVEEHREEYLNSYRIELRSHVGNVVYRRPRQLQLPLQQSSSSTKDLPEAFPYIYIHSTFPGDISVEQEYHPSVQMDQNTWRLIQKTHQEHWKVDISQSSGSQHAVLLLYFSLLIPILPVVFFGYWMLIPGFIFQGAVLHLLSRVLEKQSMQPFQTTTESVNALLHQAQQPDCTDDSATTTSSSTSTVYNDQESADNEHHENTMYNEQMAGYSLHFEKTPLPGRRGIFSHRYQLVRDSSPGSTATARS